MQRISEEKIELFERTPIRQAVRFAISRGLACACAFFDYVNDVC